MLISIGGYNFEIDKANFESMTKSSDYQWQPVERIGNNPAYQAAGKWKEEMELKGLISTSKNGLKLMEELNDLAKEMTPRLLITGYGDNLGLFIILSVSEERDVFMPTGEFLKQSYTIKLARYYE